MSVFPAPCLIFRLILPPDWNDHVVPRLLPISRSIQREVEKQEHRRNVEARQLEFAECSAPLVELYKPFLDSSALKRAPLVRELLSESNYQTPVTPERFSSIRAELVFWVDRELAPTYSAMANSFRSEHQGLLSPSISSVSDRDLLEKAITIFKCGSCKNVYDYKAYSKHGRDYHATIQVRSQRSEPAGKQAVMLLVRLLQFLGLPEDSTRRLVEQTFCETKFVCLCGNPKFKKHLGFFALVRLVLTLVIALRFS